MKCINVSGVQRETSSKAESNPVQPEPTWRNKIRSVGSDGLSRAARATAKGYDAIIRWFERPARTLSVDHPTTTKKAIN